MAAATIDYQKVTPQEVVVKISGANGDTGTIDLSADLFPQGQIALGAGTISVSGSTAVTGTGTNFTAGLVGGNVYRADTGALVGTVASVADTTHLTLGASATYSGTYGLSYRTQDLDGSTQTVTIVSAMYSGLGVANITRGSLSLVLNAAAANGKLDFGSNMVPDKSGDTSDIAVAFAASPTGNTQIWLKLRKVGGWANRTETAYFGAHDNETVVGA